MSERKILIVEDDNDLRELIEQHLTSLGLNATGAATISEAQKLIENEDDRYDIILTDLNLKDGEKGIDLAAWTRKLENSYKAKARFILMTGYHSDFDEKLAHSYGINLFLNKPFDPNLLEEQILFLLNDMNQQIAV